MAEVQILSLSPKHNYIIDRLLAEPTIKMGHLAEEMGVTAPWLSVVMHSDVFVEEYTRRRLVNNKDLSAAVVERQLRLALKAYDKLSMILDDDEVDDRLVLDAADKTAKLLGFTPSSGNAPSLREERSEVVRETLRVVSPGVVERARERIRKVAFFDNALPAPER